MTTTPVPLSTGAEPPSTPPPAGRQRIAPLWHTALLILIFIVFSWAGANSQQRFADTHGRMPVYVSTLILEWLLTAYVFWGIRKRGVTLRQLTGGRWSQPEDALLDVAIAVGFWIFALIVLGLIGTILARATGQLGGGATSQADRMAHACKQLKDVSFLAPHTGRELLVFFGLAATAGFCEEIIFRGYFQRQFAALTHVTALGVIAQAVLFGASHGYEGPLRMIVIAVYGSLFGMLAVWRRSLRPGMMAHALHDGVMGALIAPLSRMMKC